MLDYIVAHHLDKKLWVYDTFQGMSEPTEKDVSTKNESAILEFENTKNNQTGCADWCKATIDVVESTLNLISTEYKNYTNLIVGKVEDTLQLKENIPKKISLMRLDTDWYESTYHELVHLYPKLVKGGVLIIDDYGCWKGSKKAVDTYFEENNISVFLHRVDYAVRIIVKTN
jgi:hypothetical protein